MKAILKTLSDTFERLQSLQIQPTMHNVTVLQTSLSEIQYVYNVIKQEEEKAKADKPAEQEEPNEDGREV